MVMMREREKQRTNVRDELSPNRHRCHQMKPLSSRRALLTLDIFLYPGPAPTRACSQACLGEALLSMRHQRDGTGAVLDTDEYALLAHWSGIDAKPRPHRLRKVMVVALYCTTRSAPPASRAVQSCPRRLAPPPLSAQHSHIPQHIATPSARVRMDHHECKQEHQQQHARPKFPCFALLAALLAVLALCSSNMAGRGADSHKAGGRSPEASPKEGEGDRVREARGQRKERRKESGSPYG